MCVCVCVYVWEGGGEGGGGCLHRIVEPFKYILRETTHPQLLLALELQAPMGVCSGH